MPEKTFVLKVRSENRDIFEAIRDGQKKIETRAATDKYRKIKAGDKITFVCGKQVFTKQVKRVCLFKTIAALLKKYKVEQINPVLKSAKALREMYYSFPRYREKLKKYGLIVFEL